MIEAKQISAEQLDELGKSHIVRTARQVWTELGGKSEDNASEQLGRLMKRHPDFPRPVSLGRNWLFFLEEVEAWVRSRPRVESVRTRGRGLQS